jgi:hypothetical protein
MQVRVPAADVQQATLASIAVGQVGIGPITVGELVVQDVAFHLDSGVGFIRNMTVTVRLRIDFEWHIHVPLPWPFDDIDIGDTNYLGTFGFGLPPVGDVTIPGLSNINIAIPSLTAHDVSAQANPVANVQLRNAVAEQVHARDTVLPSAGFTIAGLSLTSVEGDNVSVPAAGVAEATVRRVRGDPLRLGEFSLGSVRLDSAQVPSVRSTSPFDVPANLQSRRLPFDLGLLRFALIITPSATSHIPYLEVNNSNATATTGRVVLRNVTLPFEALNLTLSQIGINTIGIPAFAAS